MNIHNPTGLEWERTRLAEFIRRHGYGSLVVLQERAASEPARFWDEVVGELGLVWTTPYRQTLDVSDGENGEPPVASRTSPAGASPGLVAARRSGLMWPRWFVGGELDLVDNLVGKHARATPDKPAVRWEGDGGEQRTLTYAELDDEVARLAAGLEGLGVAAGDRIALWLPMIPEAAVTMLAATRIGAIFIPFFSGYGADAVAQRIQDCEARVLVCADGFFRRGREVPMLEEARRAASLCPSLRHLVVVERLARSPHGPDRPNGARSRSPGAFLRSAGPHGEAGREGAAGARPSAGDSAGFFERSYASLRADAAPGRSASFPPDQTLMLIYTSGTTGKPKGVVHTHAGFPVKAAQDLMMAFDLKACDTLMWVTDMGWLMGPWMVYGGLMLGATIVLYEGTADHPDAQRLWQVVERHRVTHLGLSPSLVRLLMAMPDAVPPAETLASLRVFGSTGEAWNESPWLWLYDTVGGGRRPIINYSGGTEIGGGILACFPGLPQKPGSFSGPIPGMAVDVLGEDGQPVRGAVGELVIRQPWPGMTNGFWRDPARYEEAYWSTWPGVWVHGDWARVDEDGYWFVHGRSDDTIKVAGKRVGPADFESALVAHPLVTEAVAIGVPDEQKGESVVCFVTTADAGMLAEREWAAWERELVEHVGRALGKPLRPARVHHLRQVPKTRNGKIMRRVMRATYLGTAPGDLSSLENPAAIDEIRALRIPA